MTNDVDTCYEKQLGNTQTTVRRLATNTTIGQPERESLLLRFFHGLLGHRIEPTHSIERCASHGVSRQRSRKFIVVEHPQTFD
jgi:hypothetical protein